MEMIRRRKDYPTHGRAVMHETGSGVVWSQMIRDEFPRRERELGCIDAPSSLAAGSHYTPCGLVSIPTFVFRPGVI